MRISIDHQTTYRFDQPVSHGVQRLRLTPKDCGTQTVLDWAVEISGGQIECSYEDHNLNLVTLVSLGGAAIGGAEIGIRCRGTVETRDSAGVIGAHAGFMPLWRMQAQTELTKPGAKLRGFAGRFSLEGREAIPVLHDMMDAVAAAVAYEAGHTGADTSAEAALAAGKGVCQDHAHIFIGAARLLGLPARYVSGYLLMEGREAQDAGHGWAEVFVSGLGWVGFDVSNAQCPDERYVRLAVGADYREAAPVKGVSQGAGDSTLSVALSVSQQQSQQQQSA
jgi:transglutaminase-like putative cysteine protease